MKPLLYAALAAGVAITSPALAQQGGTISGSTAAAEGKPIEILFVAPEGEGTAVLTQTGQGVLIQVELKGLPVTGPVGFHIHEVGECEPSSGFKSAGGHFNPGDAEHGFLASNGPHAGDMPNQYVASDGTLTAEVLNPLVSLTDGNNGILERSLMVHSGPDDYRTQPSGDAGDRIACAVIGQTQ